MQLDHIVLMVGQIDGQLREYLATARDRERDIKDALSDLSDRVNSLERRSPGPLVALVSAYVGRIILVLVLWTAGLVLHLGHSDLVALIAAALKAASSVR